MTSLSGSRGRRAMQAAEMADRGECTLKEAAKLCRVGYETAKNAGDIHRSGMRDLQRAVFDGRLTVGTAHAQYQAASKAGLDGSSIRADTSHCLYLITEEDSNGNWSKVGVASHVGMLGPKIRFDEAQRGNPRKLQLAGLWRFSERKQATAVEKKLLKGHKRVTGGKEWRDGITWDKANQEAVRGGGAEESVALFNDRLRD